MGLLDFYDDPAANMALAAGLLSGGNFGQALGKGMAGAQSIVDSKDERKRRNEYMQAQAENLRNEIAKRNFDMAKEERLQKLIEQYTNGGSAPLQGSSGGPLMPQDGPLMAYGAPQGGGFAGIPPIAIAFDAANGGKNIGNWIEGRTKPVAMSEGQSYFDPATNTVKFTAPKTQFVPGDDYRPDRLLTPSGVQTLGQPSSSPEQQPAPQTSPNYDGGPNAPWRGMPPKESDDFKKRIYEAESKKLEDIRQAVRNGQSVMSDLERFGELNRHTSTGSLYDKMMPNSMHFGNNETEMIAIQNRLGPMARPPGSGSTSNWEGAQYLSALPGIDKPGPANKAIRDDYERRLNSARDELKFKEDYLTKYGHLNGADAAYQAKKAGGQPQSTIRPVLSQAGLPIYTDGGTVESANSNTIKLIQQEVASGKLDQQTASREIARLQAQGASGVVPDQKKKRATLADIAETARKSGKSTAEVTARLKELGYEIGGN